MIGVTEIAKAYETMPYGEFKAQTGYEAELYHGDWKAAVQPIMSATFIGIFHLTAIRMGKLIGLY